MITASIVCAVFALAFFNGANDNFKGVATLHGAGRLSYPRSLTLATVTTLAGSLAAIVLAQGLVRRFSGRGLVPDGVASDPRFLLAVAIGAAATVVLATWFGLPVSTTHALTGALVGVGLVMAGPAKVSFGALASSFVLPLLLSPVLALVLAVALHPALRRAEGWLRSSPAPCLCTAPALESAALVPGGGLVRVQAAPQLQVGALETCDRQGAVPLLALEAGRVLDWLHVASAGAVGFARGLNDTPKIAALLVGAQAMSAGPGTAALAAAMALGGLLAARRVARTLAFGITGMNVSEGLSANLVTAGLVVLASPLGLPVSTTHVSCGALFGIGVINGQGRGKTISTIVGAWAVTLPVAGVLSALVAAGFAIIQ
jgi:PiT family inorganic phosphate transporter